MQTTPNMGLITWDLLTDFFNHSQLKANFDAVDAHDHTPGKGVQIGAGALAPSAVTSSVLASNAVQTAAVANGAVTDAKLASPNNTAWKKLLAGYASISSGLSTGTTYYPTAAVGIAASPNSNWPSSTVLRAADLAVANKTTRLMIKGGLVSNGTAPTGYAASASLRPVTSSGANYALGAAVGSTTLPSMTANTTATFASSAFNMPTDGIYALAVNITSALPAGATIGFVFELHYNHT